MFNFFKGKDFKGKDNKDKENQHPPEPVQNQDQDPAHSPPPSWFGKLKRALTRTRHHFSEGLAKIFLGKKEIDQDLLERLENHLLTADLGVETTQGILKTLTQGISRQEIKDPQAVRAALQQILCDILKPCQQPLNLHFPARQDPFVILMVGVNGAGKTTTIGKLAKKYQDAAKTVLLAAGDTFRAAAIEQLQAWGKRHEINVVAQHSGADSASVIFDALQSAHAKNIDVLIADTAGRLHTREDLMEELLKIKRVMKKLVPQAPHEILLVLDASMGQNALIQAQQFHKALGITGIILTKLDGTAKGGIIFAIANTLKLPIRFIGVGEQAEDLRLFEAEAFVNALFEEQ